MVCTARGSTSRLIQRRGGRSRIYGGGTPEANRRRIKGFGHQEIQMLMDCQNAGGVPFSGSDSQWLTGTSIRRVPRSFSLEVAEEVSADRMFTSKNLTEQSLLLTATLGSTLLTLAFVRLSEVSMTELLMEPCSWVWYCQWGREDR